MVLNVTMQCMQCIIHWLQNTAIYMWHVLGCIVTIQVTEWWHYGTLWW